jgi:hypothetical protein
MSKKSPRFISAGFVAQDTGKAQHGKSQLEEIMMRPNWLPIAALSLLLASCFVSSEPLFGPAEADYPIQSGARFIVKELKSDGSYDANEKSQDITIIRDGAYYVYSVKGDDTPVKGLMDRLGNDAYVAFLRDENGIMYGLFQKRGDKWFRHGLYCENFETLATAHGKTLEAFGIKKNGSDCSFSNYEDLKRALAFEAEFGKPDAEYVPVK